MLTPKKFPASRFSFVAALSLATVLTVACGEEKDSRISDADALCLKMLRNGGNCGGANGQTGSTATTTTTQTATVTNSTTVTITQTGTN